jgi:hypothetical protein
MKLIIKATIILLLLVVSIKDASAQMTPKKHQMDMAKFKRQMDHIRQKAAEQQSQLKYVPMNPNNVPGSQNKSSDSSVILHNRQGVLRTKEN